MIIAMQRTGYVLFRALVIERLSIVIVLVHDHYEAVGRKIANSQHNYYHGFLCC